uniref:Neogenin C-terminal domain-containing protein n=1 Tax=Knipowitschia caucasica TaxID=637954 RepID=A0AAV2IV41_KNICA
MPSSRSAELNVGGVKRLTPPTLSPAPICGLHISPSPCPPNLTDLGLLSPLSPSPPSSPLALLQVLASLTPSSASRSNAPPPVPLPQSYEPDELTEEMAHLEGLMKDLNAITTAP